ARGRWHGPRAHRHAGAGRPLRRRLRCRRSQRRRLRRSRAPSARGDASVSVRVLVADDQALVRAGFRKILEADAQIEVVGEAGDGVEAVERSRELEPDVILMDIRMPRLDGIAATRELAGQTDGGPRVLVLTTFGLEEYVYEALRAGASGFLLKDVPPEQLLG